MTTTVEKLKTARALYAEYLKQKLALKELRKDISETREKVRDPQWPFLRDIGEECSEQEKRWDEEDRERYKAKLDELLTKLPEQTELHENALCAYFAYINDHPEIIHTLGPNIPTQMERIQ